jgi:hypothetical protein
MQIAPWSRTAHCWSQAATLVDGCETQSASAVNVNPSTSTVTLAVLAVQYVLAPGSKSQACMLRGVGPLTGCCSPSKNVGAGLRLFTASVSCCSALPHHISLPPILPPFAPEQNISTSNGHTSIVGVHSWLAATRRATCQRRAHHRHT